MIYYCQSVHSNNNCITINTLDSEVEKKKKVAKAPRHHHKLMKMQTVVVQINYFIHHLIKYVRNLIDYDMFVDDGGR